MKFFAKIRIIAVVACCALMVPFQSCTDLEPDVFSDLTPANFPVSEGEVVSSYLSSYTRLYPMQNHGGYMSMQEVASDEMMIPQRGSDWFDGGLWLRAHQHQSTPDDGVFNGSWIFLYQGALQCNSVIALLKNTTLVSEADKAQYIAELRSLRAYWYFQLADSFGDVPLVTDESDASITEPEATPRADIFNFVVSELNAAAPDLSRSTGTDTYGKINFWANRALLSRVLLNAEVMTGSAQWAAAEAAADEVINGGQYSLTSDYFENFDPNNDNGFESTSENMWVIPYDAPGVAGGFNIVQMTLHYSSQQTFSTQDQPWNGYCTLQEFYESYDDADLRKGVSGDQQTRGNFLAGPQFAVDGVTPVVDGSFDDPGGPELVFTPEINAHFPNAHRQAGARVFKYGYEIGTPNSIKNDFPIIRYAEVLMNKAEAMRRQNSAGSSMFVNMVRTRAALGDVADSMSDADFLAERGREFFFEGTRRQDLIRFDVYNSPWAFKDQSAATDQVFPIPLAQLNANKNLVQNAGY
ncbi:MAG: RagB/SusD family nutrient uptake outer membrane protein [Lewinella sp.]|nr:RagB/SusD family nutrient uptake outer membrane protein [Lewinella sp.]